MPTRFDHNDLLEMFKANVMPLAESGRAIITEFRTEYDTFGPTMVTVEFAVYNDRRGRIDGDYIDGESTEVHRVKRLKGG